MGHNIDRRIRAISSSNGGDYVLLLLEVFCVWWPIILQPLIVSLIVVNLMHCVSSSIFIGSRQLNGREKVLM